MGSPSCPGHVRVVPDRRRDSGSASSSSRRTSRCRVFAAACGTTCGRSRNLPSCTPSFREANRDRLLSASDRLAGTSALQLAALPFVQRAFDFLSGLCAVLRHRRSPRNARSWRAAVAILLPNDCQAAAGRQAEQRSAVTRALAAESPQCGAACSRPYLHRGLRRATSRSHGRMPAAVLQRTPTAETGDGTHEHETARPLPLR